MILFLLLGVGVALWPHELPIFDKKRTTTDDDYQKQWEEFKATEKKVYSSKEEHDERFLIFKDNIDKINRHNEKNLPYWFGVTPFADLTAEEFKSRTACNIMDIPKFNHTSPILEVPADGNPASVDWWRYVTQVKQQGGCGSCWAFATTGVIESRSAIKTNKLYSLSEQELLDCDTIDHACNGGLPQNAFRYVERVGGLCGEQYYPYQQRRSQCRASSCYHVDPIRSAHEVLPRNNEKALETAVASGPVAVGIEADQRSFQLYKGGVMTATCGGNVDHAVLATGYGRDSQSGLNFWKVKNSWGSNWGESGYVRLWKDSGRNGGAGQCAIAAQATYPVV